jgi:hypothetical protein
LVFFKIIVNEIRFTLKILYNNPETIRQNDIQVILSNIGTKGGKHLQMHWVVGRNQQAELELSAVSHPFGVTHQIRVSGFQPLLTGL